MSIAFDTLRFAQTLRETARFTPEQADCLSEAFARTIADRREADLALEIKIIAAKTELMKWLIYLAMGLQTIVILGAVLALNRFGH